MASWSAPDGEHNTVLSVLLLTRTFGGGFAAGFLGVEASPMLDETIGGLLPGAVLPATAGALGGALALALHLTVALS